MARTERKIDTPMTRGRSWIVRDHHEILWGPFVDVDAARGWAKKTWPNLPEVDDLPTDADLHTAVFWEIQEVNSPPGFA